MKKMAAPDATRRPGGRRAEVRRSFPRAHCCATAPPARVSGRSLLVIRAKSGPTPGSAPCRRIDFWYEFASTYSYPAAMRIEALAAAQRRLRELAAVSARAAVLRAGLARFAVQHLSRQGPLHVARPAAHLRGARLAADAPRTFPAKFAARRARRAGARRSEARRFSRAVYAGRIRRGTGDRRPRA